MPIDDKNWQEEMSYRFGQFEGKMELLLKAVYGNGQPGEFQLLHNRITKVADVTGTEMELLSGRLRNLEDDSNRKKGVTATIGAIAGALVVVAAKVIGKLIH